MTIQDIDPDVYLLRIEDAALLLDDAGWTLNGIVRALAIAVISDIEDPVEYAQGLIAMGEPK